MNNTTSAPERLSCIRFIRMRCPDCKVTIERREDLPAYESIECPLCERYIMRMFWITLSQPNINDTTKGK